MKKLLKHGEKMTLDKCFELYLQQKKINCRLCKCYEALCHEKIYTTTKVLIIAFKRKNHTYKGDIDFNLHFSMSNYVNQKENIYKKNYKLKAVISYSLVDYYKKGKKT